MAVHVTYVLNEGDDYQVPSVTPSDGDEPYAIASVHLKGMGYPSWATIQGKAAYLRLLAEALIAAADQADAWKPEQDAPDAHLEAAYEDRNGGTVEVDA